MFSVFDRPDAHQCTTRRPVSTTATQALFVLNSQFSLDMARHFASLLLKQIPDDENARIELAYRRAVARPPTTDELLAVKSFLDKQSRDIKASGRQPKDLALPIGLADLPNLPPEAKQIDPHRAAAWTDLCLVLFNLSEFVYID